MYGVPRYHIYPFFMEVEQSKLKDDIEKHLLIQLDLPYPHAHARIL